MSKEEAARLLSKNDGYLQVNVTVWEVLWNFYVYVVYVLQKYTVLLLKCSLQAEEKINNPVKILSELSNAVIIKVYYVLEYLYRGMWNLSRDRN